MKLHVTVIAWPPTVQPNHVLVPVTAPDQVIPLKVGPDNRPDDDEPMQLRAAVGPVSVNGPEVAVNEPLYPPSPLFECHVVADADDARLADKDITARTNVNPRASDLGIVLLLHAFGWMLQSYRA